MTGNRCPPRLPNLQGRKVASQPYWHFYPSDWRNDRAVRLMDFEERGMWFELLLFMRECEEYGKLSFQGKPMTEEMIAKGIGFLPQQNSGKESGKTIGKFLNLLETLGAVKRDQETGVLFSSRLLKDQKISQARSAAGTKGAKATNSRNDFAAAKVSAKVRQNRDNDNDSSSSVVSSSYPVSSDPSFFVALDPVSPEKQKDPVSPVPPELQRKSKNAYKSLWIDFDEFWSCYPRRPDDSQQGAKNAWYGAIFYDGATADCIIQGARNYKTFICESERKEKIVYSAARFINEKIYNQFQEKIEPERKKSKDEIDKERFMARMAAKGKK